jgi:hypothetical protein
VRTPAKEVRVAFSEHVSGTEADFDGYIWIDAIAVVLMEEIQERATGRDLDMIGPNRADAIGYEVKGQGVVGSTLSNKDEAFDLLSRHADAMTIPIPTYLSWLVRWWIPLLLLKEEADGSASSGLLEKFEDEIRTLLLEKDKDIGPTLQEMRSGLLRRPDS